MQGNVRWVEDISDVFCMRVPNFLRSRWRDAYCRAVTFGTHLMDTPGTTASSTKIPLILVVDDDPTNRLVLSKMLEKMQCDACLVSNGPDAIAICRTRHVDLVVMDVCMPVMDGYTATRSIRHDERQRGGPRVPIIGLSGFTHDEARRDGLASGMDVYLYKPIAPHAVSAILQKWLPGRTHVIAPPEKNE